MISAMREDVRRVSDKLDWSKTMERDHTEHGDEYRTRLINIEDVPSHPLDGPGWVDNRHTSITQGDQVYDEGNRRWRYRDGQLKVFIEYGRYQGRQTWTKLYVRDE
jgi:hypothetical protein